MPRCERQGSNARRSAAFDAGHLTGAATKQVGPCRRNPGGGRAPVLANSSRVSSRGPRYFCHGLLASIPFTKNGCGALVASSGPESFDLLLRPIKISARPPSLSDQRR